jgi:hypothetical protein
MKSLKISTAKKLLILNILGVLLLTLILRWNSFTSPFERDEGEYAYSAWIFKEGLIPYRDSFLQKPPLIIYTYLLGLTINPTAYWPPRLLATIFAFATTLVSVLIVSKEFGRNVGILAMWLMTPMLALPYFMGATANTEVFMLLPLMFLLAFYLWGREKEERKYWFWAGVASALSLLYKPICLFVILFIFLVWIYESWLKDEAPSTLWFDSAHHPEPVEGRPGYFAKGDKKFINIMENILLVFGGGILTSGIIMMPVIIKGAWQPFIESAVTYNLFYSKMRGFGLGTLGRQLGILFKNYWILSIPLIWFFVKRPPRWSFYVGLLLTSILGVFQSPIGHYYLLVMPFLAIIVAVGLEKLVTDIRKISVLKASILVLVFMLWPVRSQFNKTPEEINLMIYGTANPFLEAPLVARHLAEITSSKDLVFVGGSEPEILFYAKRKSSSRFVITYPLIIETPVRIAYQKEAMKNLEENPPKAIVISQRQYSGLWNEESPKLFINYLNEMLAGKYKLIGGYVWDTKGGYWSENLDKEDILNSSLLLYQKK